MRRAHLMLVLVLSGIAVAVAVARRPARVEAMALQDAVPQAAVDALRQGQFLRASLVLREYLDARSDSVPGALLIAAEAEAGWGDWERVEQLLAGRSWLDSLAAGRGWYLLGRSQAALGQWRDADGSFARYLDIARAAGDRDRGAAELNRARALRQADDHAAAQAAYGRAAALLPDVADWIAIEAADAAAGAADTATVEALLARSAGELARERGWRIRVRAAINASDLARAETIAAAAAEAATSANTRAEAWARLGEVRLLREDSAGARAAFLRALTTAPGGAGVEGARLLSTMPGLGPNERLLIGRTYARHGNLDRGIAGLEAYLESNAGSAAERAAVRSELASALFRAGRYAEAEAALLRVAEQAASYSAAAAAMFEAGRAQYRSGKQTAARQTFQRIAERYPDTDAAAQALYLSADLAHDELEIERATERYQRAIRSPSDVEEVGLAYMRLANLAYLQGDYARALETFDAYRSKYPNGRRWQQATYWSALSLEKIGETEPARGRLRAAHAADPLSYYGARAAERLGADFWEMRLGAEPPADAARDAEVARALARADLLTALEWPEAASHELARVRARFERAPIPALYSLAEALNARGETVTGIAIGWDIHRREGGWNPRLLRVIYPLPFRELIVAEARDLGVDPFLAAALIRQESMFNPRAVSGAGAIGLMQVMPQTGATLARELGVRRFSADMLKRPEVNVHFGMQHLADQLAAYDGRLTFVLSAYNAGGSRIDRWREFPEAADDELFAERIPFAETRDYVKIVQQNARIYEALYGDLDPSGDQASRR